MDEPTRRALASIVEAVAEAPPPGPIALTEDYLRAVERAEQLPANASGADKTWTELALDNWMSAVAQARRIPVE